MTMGANGVFKCSCPPKYSGALCEGKLVFEPCVLGTMLYKPC